ncbi:MAG: hypothetical protein CVU56_04950 [Deltaproteobacteria bacterium HGW-Deltaproteobacteria-14]|jgi:hypothetical protein|nr:MAG: hypothetical protein CVU56_04950 [Deltaproteobacteria bacterium HGW-Deltaproteobacteria-14]
MAKPTYDSVSRLADKLHRQYQAEYAGKPRHTRPLEPIERVIGKMRALAGKAAKLAGPKGREVEKIVTDRLALYVHERDAIAAARFEDPSVAEMHGLSQGINRALALWRRHFSGQNRLVVDLSLLDQIVSALAAARPRLAALLEEKRSLELSGALNTVESELMLIADERSEIEKARRNATPEQRAAALATRANRWLDQVRIHFTGHPRASCEPERLREIVRRLEAIAEEMRAPEHAAAHADNVALIAERTPALAAEADAIAAAIAAAKPREVASVLGAAANRIIELYAEHFAGQSRATRNLSLLGDLCDRLGSIRDQMAGLLTDDDTVTANNLHIVESRLEAYEQEWVEIAKAKASQATGTPEDPLGGFLR